jgi:hypothetical protein
MPDPIIDPATIAAESNNDRPGFRPRDDIAVAAACLTAPSA